LAVAAALGLALGQAPAARAQIYTTADPGYIAVNGTQPAPPEGYIAPGTYMGPQSNPVVSSYTTEPVTPAVSSYIAPGTYTVPGTAGTTYIQENTVVPPPNINGVPYVVAGAETYVSPGGSYCTEPDGGQVFVPNGASPAVYGC
jgi:hypothetical protein